MDRLAHRLCSHIVGAGGGAGRDRGIPTGGAEGEGACGLLWDTAETGESGGGGWGERVFGFRDPGGGGEGVRGVCESVGDRESGVDELFGDWGDGGGVVVSVRGERGQGWMVNGFQ